MKHLVVVYCLFIFLVCGDVAYAQFGQIKEKVNSHLKADPLTISGSIGGSITSSWNNQDIYAYSTPFQTTAFANFVIGIYGFNIPININLLNVSMTQFSFPHPTISLNMTPQYKNWKFHIGTSSMHFSNYTYAGLNFNGLGFEYNGKLFRAAAFYGTLQQATRFKEYDNRSAIQYYADSLLGLNVYESTEPQFKRTALGAKIGVGNSKNFLDINFLKAVDDTNSLPEVWHIGDKNDTVYRDSIEGLTGKENLDIGLSGRFSIGKWFSFTTNIGMSVYTDDISATAINSESLGGFGVDTTDPNIVKAQKLLNQFDWVYIPRINSQVRFAGDAAVNFNFKHVTAIFNYRFVQPDYTSLGANRFSQNSEGVGGNLNFNMFKNHSFLNLVGYLQHDNLDGSQMYKNQVATYSANWNNTIGNNVNVSLSYNGIKQDQMDGTSIVNDTTRINQITHTFTIAPSFTFETMNSQSISLNFNTIQNRNLNKLSITNYDVSTYTIGASYDITLTDIGLMVGGSYDYSDSKAKVNSYSSHAFGVNLNYTIVKTKDFNCRATYTASLAFNNSIDSEGDDGLIDPDDLPELHKTNSLSFSNRLGASLNYKKAHRASCFLTMSNYSENIVIGQKISTSFDLRFHIAYTYSFAARIIKNKNKKQEQTSIIPEG